MSTAEERENWGRIAKSAMDGAQLGAGGLEQLYTAVPALLDDVDRITAEVSALQLSLERSIDNEAQYRRERDAALAELATVRAERDEWEQKFYNACKSIGGFAQAAG
jgi:uncharacterized protein (DUF3084 family)